MNRIALLVGYAVIMAASILLAMFAIAQPAEHTVSDRSTNLLAGAGIGFATCIFFKDGVGLLQSRRIRRNRPHSTPPAH